MIMVISQYCDNSEVSTFEAVVLRDRVIARASSTTQIWRERGARNKAQALCLGGLLGLSRMQVL